MKEYKLLLQSTDAPNFSNLGTNPVELLFTVNYLDVSYVENDCDQDEFTLEWNEPSFTQDLGVVIYEIGGSADKDMSFTLMHTKPYCTPNFSVYKESTTC